MENISKSRRDFILKSSLGLGAATVGMGTFSSFSSVNQENKKLGIALVGLGYYAEILADALQETKHAYLAGIVTGTPGKEPIWQKKYGVKKENTYNYENYDELSKNKEIDIIYVVLPNSMHKEYTIRAAQAGKHVICEKPMALNAQECREMIAACNKAGVKLSIGYRMHFEPTTQEIMRIAREKEYGEIRYVNASAGFRGNFNPDHWKVLKKYGGGAMMDMGVYSLQATRYATGEEPISVSAQDLSRRTEKYEAEETVTFQVQFPSGAIGNGHTSFYEGVNHLYTKAQNGWYTLDPFSAYRGIKGNSSSGPLDYPVINQQAAQMDGVAQSIKNNEPMLVPGEEGLKDMIVVDAVYESIRNGGKRIMLG